MTSLRILVPVDFSQLSEAAARHAAALAACLPSTVTFAHVYSPQLFRYVGGIEGGAYIAQVIPPREDVLAEAHQWLHRLAAGVGLAGASERILLEGEPAAEIVRYVRERQIGLVVMPTRGFGPFRRFILGSVAAKVLHDVDCPVFTCPHHADLAVQHPQPYRRVACAVDLGPHSLEVLRWAKQFAAVTGAELAVIFAAPAVSLSGLDLGVEVRSKILDAVNANIQQLLAAAGCDAAVYADCAELLEYVPAMAAQFRADLLVVGRTTKQGFLGRLRSNTYALIRESPCPVVSV